MAPSTSGSILRAWTTWPRCCSSSCSSGWSRRSRNYQHQRKIERQQQFAALALGHGLDFSIDGPFDTLGEPFALLRRGDGRGVENVLWGEWKGLEIRAFDYWYYEESTDSKGHTSRSYSRFDCVFTRIDASCPALQISEENVFTRLADSLTFRDIEFDPRSSTAGSR